jgi:FixJ family two-component response regulator
MTDGVLVSVVDDDESVRESIPDLLRAFGFSARAFTSAEDFLASDVVDATQCVILDVAMPGMSGPELFEELKRRPLSIPVIFVTAHGNTDLCAQLLKDGAVACLHKPFDPPALVEALQRALPNT